MKNRAKTISLLLAVCMMITMLPAVAFAAGDILENVKATVKETYENGWIKKVEIKYTVSSNKAAVDMKYGIQTYKFNKSLPTNSYGDFTERGYYASNNGSYTAASWNDAPSSIGYDSGIGFVAWARALSSVDANNNDVPVNNNTSLNNYGTANRPGSNTTQTDTIEFAENSSFNKDKSGTYYVYGWVDYAGSVYPDGLVCVFNVKEDGTFEQVAEDPDDNTGGGNTGNNNTGNTPGTTAPAKSSIDLWYNGGNSFGSSKSAVPTSVEIDGVAVGFTGNGREFSVGCVPADAKWVTVRWNSTSITTNFTPDAAASCIEIDIPKTGDMPILAAIAGFLGF